MSRTSDLHTAPSRVWVLMIKCEQCVQAVIQSRATEVHSCPPSPYKDRVCRNSTDTTKLQLDLLLRDFPQVPH